MPAPSPLSGLPQRAATTDGLPSPASIWDSVDSPTSSNGMQRSSSGDTLDYDVVPPYHPARTLVLCFDGTGDQFDADNSNIVKFFSLLKKDDRNEQMVYYQPGIGTYSSAQSAYPLRAKLDNLLDSMFAWHLSDHVSAGYEFLMQNYNAGDKICLFGFSRGAYTARALAGMLHKVGLLPACNHQQVPFAYKMFTREDELGWKQSTVFKKAFSIDVDIDFIGVWDTVASVGLVPRTLPFTTSNRAIRVFRHAVALDERRARFQANLYKHPSKQDAERGTRPGDMPKTDTEYATRVAVSEPKPPKLKKNKKKKQASLSLGGGGGSSRKQYERLFNSEDAGEHSQETDVLEVWFAGCHCDVGGGSVTDDVPHTLARIPLRWMIRECFRTNTGIRFHGDLLRAIGLDPAALHPLVAERPPPLQPDAQYMSTVAPPLPQATEEEHEIRDALSPVYDQLDLAWYWWFLEFMPMKKRVLGPAPEYKQSKQLTLNRGTGRVVPKRHKPFYVHRSVKLRMEAKGLKDGPYMPKAQYINEPIWVD
ncbi:hypothetical protein BV20DRAFT_434793 [Pilatotrama ljubarskyi]|nr:hypothetical protein BV20DRAFT_434793 [Pilatotrama ljubarskyi]